MRGRVHGTEGGIYRVLLESGELVHASLRGRLKREARTGDRVVIGDRVEVGFEASGTATVEGVLERTSQVVRRGPGGRRAKVVAANVDRLLVVASAARPEPRQGLLDRLLTVGEANRLETLLVFNKIDLLDDPPSRPEESEDRGRTDPRALSGLYRKIGYTVLATSAKTGEGLVHLQACLEEGISALVGPSGVGKSSLLNAMEPGLGLRTGELSHRVGRGRQTTVSARLLRLSCGGMVADTPGFSDVGLWGVGPEALERCFPEFGAFREECRFRGCTHLHEPDCQVREAMARGEIDATRFESYRTLVQEATSL